MERIDDNYQGIVMTVVSTADLRSFGLASVQYKMFASLNINVILVLSVLLDTQA